MDVLELRVAAECKEAFAELQTEITEIGCEVQSAGKIFFSKLHACAKMPRTYLENNRRRGCCTCYLYTSSSISIVRIFSLIFLADKSVLTIPLLMSPIYYFSLKDVSYLDLNPDRSNVSLCTGTVYVPAPTREYIDLRWLLSCVHSVMMVFSVQIAEGGGPCPPPLNSVYPATQVTLPSNQEEMKVIKHQLYPVTY
jgi:hypothetical protein